MASNRSKMRKFARVRADMIDLQPQQMEVDARYNGTEMTQITKASELVEATSNPTEPSTFPTEDRLTLESTNWLGSVKAQCSLNHDKTSAQFHSDRSVYLLAPEITAQKEFSVEKVTIEYGDFKGHQALVIVPVPKKTFDFFGLPPEIRNMIYTLLLTEPDHVIAIQGGKNKRLRGGFYHVIQRHRHNESWPGYPYHDFKTLPVGTEVCKTNHRVHDEATAILYGQNTFRIIASDTSCDFLDDIGTNTSLLRYIEFWGEQNNYFRRRFGRMAEYLPEARNLKRLEIRFCKDVFSSRWGDGLDLFEVLKPFMKTVHDQEKDVEKVLGIIELRRSHRYNCPVVNLQPTTDQPCSNTHCEGSRAAFNQIITTFEAHARHYLTVGPERRDTGRPKRSTARTIDYSLLKDDE